MNKYQKQVSRGSSIILLGIAINIIESIYFAWNTDGQLVHEKAMSNAEHGWDILCTVLIYYGLILFISPLFKLYDNALKNLEDEKDASTSSDSAE